jgi:predicted GTPase
MTTENPLVRLHDDFVEIRPTLETVFQGDADALAQVAQTAEKLAKDAREGQLNTLVFGHYNAGKSTFINALLGREAAPMGDVPLTAHISRYDWHGHVLFDSPGIDAPIEHEAVTDDFLRRDCNAIIFVISTGGAVEEASTWDRLCTFVREKKAVLIVINDKSGLDLNGTEFVRIRTTIYQNMQLAAARLDMKDPVPDIDVIHVKAQTALKARLEDKPTLLARTGIQEAEAVLLRFFSAATEKILRSDSERARKQANEALHRLAQQSGDDAFVALTACRHQVEQERTRLDRTLVEAVRGLAAREVRGAQDDVARLELRNGAQANQLLVDILEQSQLRLQQGLTKQLQIELERTDIVVRDAAKLLSQFVLKGSAELDRVQLQATAPSYDESDEAGSARSSAWFDAIKGVDTKSWTESGVKELLKYGKDWFPRLFKGIGPKTMGRWAGMAGKAVGPLLAIGQGAWELYQANQEEAEQRERHRKFVEQVMTVVRRAFDDAVTEYELKIGGIARDALTPILEALDRRTVELQSQSQTQRALQDRLASWTRKFEH